MKKITAIALFSLAVIGCRNSNTVDTHSGESTSTIPSAADGQPDDYDRADSLNDNGQPEGDTPDNTPSAQRVSIDTAGTGKNNPASVQNQQKGHNK
jgi:hypothetical protein